MSAETNSPPNIPSTIRIAVVDDDENVRSTLADAVGRFENCQCVGCFGSGDAALAGIASQVPDVVLMDINMPGMNGIECVGKLKAAHPRIEVIMLTVYQDADNVLRSLAVGANGYLLKRASREELLAAIHQVLSGGSPMSSQIARKLVQAFRQPVSLENETSKLSAREQEVLALLAKGFLYKEIALHLNIGYDTVHNYIRRIYEKLRVRSRGQAVAKYFEQSPFQRPPFTHS
jgi:DNA-binding NarL/FixJ family response regulator